MLTLLAVLVVAPVQDRAISVAEFIKSFDDDKIRHTASKQMGEHIIFVHAPEADSESIKGKLAKALSATWQKTDAGFRLERSAKEAAALKGSEASTRKEIIEGYKSLLRKELESTRGSENKSTDMIRSLLALQEKYRTAPPRDFKPDTRFPVDFLALEMFLLQDSDRLAHFGLQEFVRYADKVSGDLEPLPNGSIGLIETYVKDRQEIGNLAETILQLTSDGPLNDWIARRIESNTAPKQITRVMAAASRTAFGVQVFDEKGSLFDSALMWLPQPKSKVALDIPAVTKVSLGAEEFAFVESTYGYSFIKTPKPEAIDLIYNLEPLCAVEPVLAAIAKIKDKPLIAVLDDVLLNAFDKASGNVQDVASFLTNAENSATLTSVSDEWIILRPLSLIDTEYRRADRTKLAPFLAATKKAGFVRIADYIQFAAACRMTSSPILESILTYVDRNGYVLVEHKERYFPPAPRMLASLLKHRGDEVKTALELPLSALPAEVRNDVWHWAIRGIGSLEVMPGYTFSHLELVADIAFPNGVRGDTVLRVTPLEEGSIGTIAPFKAAYSAQRFGEMAAGMAKHPRELLETEFHFGTRRGLKLEIVLKPGIYLTDHYLEAAEEMRNMRGYNSLPEEFRKQVEQSYEEMRKLRGGSN